MLSAVSNSSHAQTARAIARVFHTAPPEPGFIGEGHTAVEVLAGIPLTQADPFVLLMDDRLAIPKRRAIGGAHPHAGLETVTLLLEGSVDDREEGKLSAGEAIWMTAGRGIVHNEHVEVEGTTRVLQLWIGLPERHRRAAPALQVIRSDDVKVLREPGVSVRLYSGSLGALRSNTQNLVPVTLAEITLERNARVELELNPRHAGFLYVVSGALSAGSGATPIHEADVAWLDRPSEVSDSSLTLQAGAGGARVVLYAGEPHGEPLVQRGPFVAESEETIARFFHEYRSGRFRRVSELAHTAAHLT